MMIKIENNVIVDENYSLYKLKKENPTTCFPKVVDEETLNSYGVYTVANEEAPIVSEIQSYRTITPIIIDGVWTAQYEVFYVDIDEAKARLSSIVKRNTLSDSPVTINDITYNGGDSSASAIAGAIQLAQTLGETTVKLWDINNVIREYTFEEAMNVFTQIAKSYRDAMLKRQDTIMAINACTTIEELETIEI